MQTNKLLWRTQHRDHQNEIKQVKGKSGREFLWCQPPPGVRSDQWPIQSFQPQPFRNWLYKKISEKGLIFFSTQCQSLKCFNNAKFYQFTKPFSAAHVWKRRHYLASDIHKTENNTIILETNIYLHYNISFTYIIIQIKWKRLSRFLSWL